MLDVLASPAQNATRLAEALAKPIDELVVGVLDKPRHASLVAELRGLGVRVHLVGEGDVSIAIAAATPGSGIDAVMGMGGTPEGIIAACAVRSLGGFMQGAGSAVGIATDRGHRGGPRPPPRLHPRRAGGERSRSLRLDPGHLTARSRYSRRRRTRPTQAVESKPVSRALRCPVARPRLRCGGRAGAVLERHDVALHAAAKTRRPGRLQQLVGERALRVRARGR